jgi:hypothetical protein
MDWIRENKTLATIAGIFLAGALALGALLLVSHFSYGESLETFTSKASQLASKERAPLYPNEANVKALEEKVAGYEEKVGSLGTVLLKLQVEAKDMTDTDFQAKLKQQIADIRAKADAAKCKLPKDFAFGFDTYTVSLPRSPAAARDLNDFFDSVSAVVNASIDAGVGSIDTIARSELAVEKDAPRAAPEPTQSSKSKAKGKPKMAGKATKPVKEVTQVVERRQLTLVLTTDQRPLQTLMNNLASPSKMPYFTVVRNLRVENEKQDGPLRNAPMPEAQHGSTSEAQEPSPKPGGENVAPKVEVITSPKAANPDAMAVIGNERLKVYFEIDIIRYVTPSAESPDSGSSR